MRGVRVKISRRSHLVVVPEQPERGQSWYDEQDRLQRLQEEQVAESDHHALPPLCDEHDWTDIRLCQTCFKAEPV